MPQQNPLFDENVNVSKKHPLVDLLWLAGGAVLIMVVVTIILYASMQWLAPYIPFKYEQRLVADFAQNTNTNADDAHVAYLQNLADKLAEAQGIDDAITIQVHWVDDETVNAFATLGGHIFITSGLWEAVPNENALAMVISHEIAHVNHRDPLKSLGAGVMLAIIQQIIFGDSDSAMALVGNSGLITSLHFNRSMESEADIAAIKTLYTHYGHVAGATSFFETINKADAHHIELLQTHPLSQNRINALKQLQTENNWPSKVNQVVKLPILQ